MAVGREVSLLSGRGKAAIAGGLLVTQVEERSVGFWLWLVVHIQCTEVMETICVGAVGVPRLGSVIVNIGVRHIAGSY